jgi:hypothetical protein
LLWCDETVDPGFVYAKPLRDLIVREASDPAANGIHFSILLEKLNLLLEAGRRSSVIRVETGYIVSAAQVEAVVERFDKAGVLDMPGTYSGIPGGQPIQDVARRIGRSIVYGYDFEFGEGLGKKCIESFLDRVSCIVSRKEDGNAWRVGRRHDGSINRERHGS